MIPAKTIIAKNEASDPLKRKVGRFESVETIPPAEGRRICG